MAAVVVSSGGITKTHLMWKIIALQHWFTSLEATKKKTINEYTKDIYIYISCISKRSHADILEVERVLLWYWAPFAHLYLSSYLQIGPMVARVCLLWYFPVEFENGLFLLGPSYVCSAFYSPISVRFPISNGKHEGIACDIAQNILIYIFLFYLLLLLRFIFIFFFFIFGSVRLSIALGCDRCWFNRKIFIALSVLFFFSRAVGGWLID